VKVSQILFEAYLKCRTKCFLRSRGEAGTANAYADWVQSQNESYRQNGVKRLSDTVTASECAIGPPVSENVRMAKWRLAVDFVAAGDHLASTIHAVERISSAGRSTPTQFIPTRFVFTNKLTRDDKLLLAFDAFALSEVTGDQVRLGKIVHGDNHATLKVKTDVLTGELAKLIDKTAKLVSSDSPPDLILNRHCAECEFQARCRQKAVEKDDLSLLSSMTEKEHKKFNSKGIFTVTQLSFTFRPRRRPKQLRNRQEKYHHALKALAIQHKKIHIVGTPRLKIEGTPVYLDVEALPDRDFYYLIGVQVNAGDSVVHRSFWADDVDGEIKVWRDFLDMLADVERESYGTSGSAGSG
jgi:predicted RecB family nuclease